MKNLKFQNDLYRHFYLFFVNLAISFFGRDELSLDDNNYIPHKLYIYCRNERTAIFI